jgi:hypothetical protein
MEKIDVKETLKSAKERVIKNFIDCKLETESFTEEQVGLIKGWLSDAVDVGFGLGEKFGMVSFNPEAMNKFSDILNNALGGGNDVDKLKNYMMMQRHISRHQSIVVGFYESIIDSLYHDANLIPNAGIGCVLEKN